MTIAQNPLIAFALAAKPEVEDVTWGGAGVPIGAADVEADIARSGGRPDPHGGSRDTDGVAVGEADHEADKVRSGVRRPRG
jgi:hypothetical protein